MGVLLSSTLLLFSLILNSLSNPSIPSSFLSKQIYLPRSPTKSKKPVQKERSRILSSSTCHPIHTENELGRAQRELVAKDLLGMREGYVLVPKTIFLVPFFLSSNFNQFTPASCPQSPERYASPPALLPFNAGATRGGWGIKYPLTSSRVRDKSVDISQY